MSVCEAEYVCALVQTGLYIYKSIKFKPKYIVITTKIGCDLY